MNQNLFLGTSSWSAEGWENSFYPPKTRQADDLSHYARQFNTVECDAAFYAIPSAKTVQG